MWLSRARARIELAAHGLVLVVAGLVTFFALSTKDIVWGDVSIVVFVVWMPQVRFFLRCDRCRRSILWWAYRNATAFGIENPLMRLEACPYCGYRHSGARGLAGSSIGLKLAMGDAVPRVGFRSVGASLWPPEWSGFNRNLNWTLAYTPALATEVRARDVAPRRTARRTDPTRRTPRRSP